MSEPSIIALQAEFDADCWLNVLQCDRDESLGLWTVRDGMIRDTIDTLRKAAAEIDRLSKELIELKSDVRLFLECGEETRKKQREAVELFNEIIAGRQA